MPLTEPVALAMVRPVGRPEAVQVSVWPVVVSVALLVTAVMAEPDTFDLLPGLVTDTVPVMVQVKDVDPVKLDPSVAVTVTEQVQAVVGVPVTEPVEELMVRPAGRPEADQVSVAPDWESVAALVSVVMAEPVTLDLLDTAVTATVLVTVQVKVVEPANDEPSVAVMVTV